MTALFFILCGWRHLHQTDGIIVKKTYGFWTWQAFGFIFVQHFVRSLIRKVSRASDNLNIEGDDSANDDGNCQ